MTVRVLVLLAFKRGPRRAAPRRHVTLRVAGERSGRQLNQTARFPLHGYAPNCPGS